MELKRQNAPGAEYPYECRLAEVLRPLKQKQMKLLAGQAFHMELITTMVVWTLATMVERTPVDPPASLQAPASSSAAQEDDQDDCASSAKRAKFSDGDAW